MIERLVITGLINSAEYLQQVRSVWDSNLLESSEAYYLAQWCIEYYDEFTQPPGRTIEDIYFQKKREGDIPADLVESIRDDLEDLADEYEEDFNLQYALRETQKYMRERHLKLHREKIKELMNDGELEAAEAMAANYKGPAFDLVDGLNLEDPESLSKVENAFNSSSEQLIHYPGALGELFNDQLVRGGFVTLMGPEKRGKSYRLLEMTMRACSQRRKVAFFQAGDMTEGQQIKRIASYLTKLPILEKQVGTFYIPQKDCIMNQLDICDKEERRCGFGPFTGGEFDEYDLRKNVRRENLLEAWEDLGEDYTPCTICDDFKEHRWGTPWLVQDHVSHALTVDEAKRAVDTFFIQKKRHLRISTHPNDTLTVSMIRNICDRWERTDGFVPDIIVIDYADLLVPEKTSDFRHGQNEIWKNLRSISQSRDCLVLTATQADSKSYERNLLTMSNFSEDKRKLSHVTAAFGLNQDKDGREKLLGIMRINPIVIREGTFDISKVVSVLQSLDQGRPFLDSYI